MAEGRDRGGPAVPPYGVAIQDAIATGDVQRMRETAERAANWLREHGDVSAAVESLRTEIARREAGRK